MVLYGAQRVFFEKLDPVTLLPYTDANAATYLLKCAESVDFEPVQEDGDESNLRCPSSNAVLATRRQESAFIGYDVTLTDNEFNPDVFALINGFDKVVEDGETNTIVTPMLSVGQKFDPFRMIVFVAAYEGATIARYVVFVLNFCKGEVSSISLSQDWSQFEYTIHAREGTKAGLPVMSVGYYTAEEAPDDLTGITITSGVLQPGAPAAEGVRGASFAKVTKVD